MTSHTNQGTCPNCEEKLTEASPFLQSWFLNFVKILHPTAHISWSYRDKANQEMCFKAGTSKLHYPDSAHNFTDPNGKPCSRALDLFLLDDTRHPNQALFDQKFYHDLDAANGTRNMPIAWGGKYAELGDFDHFQMV